MYHNPILIAGIRRRVIWVLTFQCAFAAIARSSSVVLCWMDFKTLPSSIENFGVVVLGILLFLFSTYLEVLLRWQ